MSYSPSPIDIVTVAQVKSWPQPQNTSSGPTSDDQTYQLLITAASEYFLYALGYGNPDGSTPAQSPLVQPVALTETYDGSGSDRQFTRITPIQSVQSLSINGTAVAASTSFNVSGYVIDNSRRSISLRSGVGGGNGQPFTFASLGYYAGGPWGTGYGYGNSGWVFPDARQNITISYTAGFTVTPMRIVQAVIQLVTLNAKRRSWVDQKSVSLKEGGTLAYRDWAMNPEIMQVMIDYTRRAPVG
jgi:hypothetical protein